MDKQKKARLAAMEADRAAAGLSFRALGTAAGVSDSRIRDAIKDVSNMTDDNWAKVAAALRAHFQASERAQSGASRTEDSKLAALLEKDGIEIPAPATPRSGAQSRTEGPDSSSGIVSIPFGLLRPNPQNYRKTFLPEDIEQLAESIAEKGMLQNLVVFPAGKDGIHTINSGGRRYAALNLLFNARRIDADYPVACLVKDMKQDEARALALIENLQRQDVPVLEEAEGFKALTALGWDTEKIAAACHIAQRTVQDRLQLFDKLKPVARAALSRGEITLDQARAIVSTPVEAEQNELVTFAVRNGYNAAALRDKAKAGKVRVGKAEFDLKLYKGEFIGTGADRVFADTAAFMKLQMKEARKRADELRESGRFKSVTLVEPGNEGFDWTTHERVEEADVTDENAAELDLWVSIDKWQHTIDIDYGRPDPEAAAAEDPFAEDVAAEEEHAAQTEL
ncbi:MAG: ParB/RepB/Spo0J family partition protein, partial [Pseudomonadota bacterium]